ncbi:MAG: hypothetical protein K6U79_07945 [Firmicutes bacterium]|nr:hypothetical protein [Bacillota bacterium]
MARRAAGRPGHRPEVEVLPALPPDEAGRAEACRAREEALRLLAEWIRAAGEPGGDGAAVPRPGGREGGGGTADAGGHLPPRLHG